MKIDYFILSSPFSLQILLIEAVSYDVGKITAGAINYGVAYECLSILWPRANNGGGFQIGHGNY